MDRVRERSEKKINKAVNIDTYSVETVTGLDVNRCCGLVVRTERQKVAPAVSQCHRCQRFGHAQGKCSAQPKCVKCGKGHHSGDCKKQKSAPVKCANCAGAHPASYRGCLKFPKKAPQKKRLQPHRYPSPRRSANPKEADPHQKLPPRRVSRRWPKRAAGGAAQRTSPATKSQVTAADLTTMLSQMQQMCAAMGAFFANMPAITRG